MKVGAVNCDDDQNKPLCGEFDVKGMNSLSKSSSLLTLSNTGFPTIKLFPSKVTESKKGSRKIPEDYNGARSAGAMGTSCTNINTN